jgi:hypothetical protein
VPIAFVVVAEGAGVPVAELAAWAADRVPERAAAPKHVEFVDEIPLTAVGKPFKPELRRRAAEQAAKDALAGTAVHARVQAGSSTGGSRSSSRAPRTIRPSRPPSPPMPGAGGSPDGRLRRTRRHP